MKISKKSILLWGLLPSILICCMSAVIALNTPNNSANRVESFLNDLSKKCQNDGILIGYSGQVSTGSITQKCMAWSDFSNKILSGSYGASIKGKACGNTSGSGFVTGFQNDGSPICKVF